MFVETGNRKFVIIFALGESFLSDKNDVAFLEINSHVVLIAPFIYYLSVTVEV